jgi:hypothetical protein
MGHLEAVSLAIDDEEYERIESLMVHGYYQGQRVRWIGPRTDWVTIEEATVAEVVELEPNGVMLRLEGSSCLWSTALWAATEPLRDVAIASLLDRPEFDDEA